MMQRGARMARAHLADLGLLKQGAALPVEISVMIERDVSVIDDAGEVVGSYTAASFFADQVRNLRQGDSLTVTDETWYLDKPLKNDGHIVTWYIRNG
jgi:hypothetical protein